MEIKKIMSKTLAYIGASPLLSLLTGGFKVGELLKKGIFDDSLIQIIMKRYENRIIGRSELMFNTFAKY